MEQVSRRGMLRLSAFTAGAFPSAAAGLWVPAMDHTKRFLGILANDALNNVRAGTYVWGVFPS